MSIFKKYGYAWVTLGFFLISITGHLFFGAWAYLDEHGAGMGWLNGFLVEWARDTFENWQSEFLQLLWQVGGLAFLLYLNSPQSKEGAERLEHKVDWIMETTGAIYAKAGLSANYYIGNEAVLEIDSKNGRERHNDNRSVQG